MNYKQSNGPSKQRTGEYKSARFTKNAKMKKGNPRENQATHKTVAKVSNIVPLKMSAIEKMLEEVHSVIPVAPAVHSDEIPLDLPKQSPRRGYQNMESAFQESNESCDEAAKKKLQQQIYNQVLQEQIMEKKKAKEKLDAELAEQDQIKEELASTKKQEDSIPESNNIKKDIITGSRRAQVPNRIDVIQC